MIDRVIEILKRKSTIPEDGITFNEICRAHTIAQESMLLWIDVINELNELVYLKSNVMAYGIACCECCGYVYTSVDSITILNDCIDCDVINNTIKILSRLSTIPDDVSFEEIDKAYDIAIAFLSAWNIVIDDIDNRINVFSGISDSFYPVKIYCKALQQCKEIIEKYKDKNDFGI